MVHYEIDVEKKTIFFVFLCTESQACLSKVQTYSSSSFLVGHISTSFKGGWFRVARHAHTRQNEWISSPNKKNLPSLPFPTHFFPRPKMDKFVRLKRRGVCIALHKVGRGGGKRARLDMQEEGLMERNSPKIKNPPFFAVLYYNFHTSSITTTMRRISKGNKKNFFFFFFFPLCLFPAFFSRCVDPNFLSSSSREGPSHPSLSLDHTAPQCVGVVSPIERKGGEFRQSETLTLIRKKNLPLCSTV